MLDDEVLFNLKGGNYYVTGRDSDAFRVRKGTVLVYIAPMMKETLGRRSFIYEAKAGEVIPSFSYKDTEGRTWHFCLVALEEATIEIVEYGSTKVLKERFSKKANVKNYQMEGYNGGLVDQYRINIVTEDSFIRRSQKERISASERVSKLIYGAFCSNETAFFDKKSKNPLYNAVALLGERQHITVASFERLREACGDDFSISDIARVSNFAYREVILEPGWYRQDSGAFLVYDNQKKVYACLPKGDSSYILYDAEEGCCIPVSKESATAISPRAYMLYRSLPDKKLEGKDIFTFCRACVKRKDICMLLLMTIATALVGLLPPFICQKLYDVYIPLGAKESLFQVGCVLVSFMMANILFSIVKNLVKFRITSRMSYDVQGAVFNRLFCLRESFFRKYESADLAQRALKAGNIVNTIGTVLTTSAMTGILVIVYLTNMLSYSGKLTAIGLGMIFVYAVICYLISVGALNYRKQMEELEGKTYSVMFQLLSGIAKIRIAGVEDRALYEYMKPYIKLRNYEAKYNTVSSYGTILSAVSNSVFTIVLYVVLIKGNQEISLGAFVAFNSLFAAFTAYVLQLVQGLVSLKALKPELERIRPIMEELPEYDAVKELPGDISGAIEVNNVSFSYGPDMSMVLNNININIAPGEYIGIVGPSGCGKTTLLKLLLGFEKTTHGKIYYDNKDIEGIDKRELRKNMGVVLQADKLISGSIFENITIAAPKATIADVKTVISKVGLEKDIAKMPMGLHTMLSEDCGTISGGQQQRILIARALISNPKIVFFDEATSALDNVTQRMVCETLEKLDSTRIVIAHRLSTIIKCDRIIVMEAGRVVEQGTYEELMKKKELFYRLADRQLV